MTPGSTLLPEGGVRFRLWAPNASAVSVELQGQATPARLASGPGGFWSAEVKEAAAGTRYRYLVEAGGSLVGPRVDPYAREIEVSGADRWSVVYDDGTFNWTTDGYRSPGWTEMVIYEMHVGTFNELPGQQVGTFEDAGQKLPYLAQLGVNAIELLPPSQFDGTLSWGYNPTDPFAVEAVYGGPDGLKGFIDAAHQFGIAVIIDVVYNHLGANNNDLWDFDGPTPPPGGIWFYTDWREHTGWGSRPDYDRPEVRQYFVDNAVHWLEAYRADGLRFDATAWIRSVDGSLAPDQWLPNGWLLLQAINAAVDQRQPWKIRIAEDMRHDPAVTSSLGTGGAGCDSQWDPGFVHEVRGVLEQARDEDRDMNAIARAIQRRYGEDAFTRVVFTESHDADANGGSRLPTEIDPGDPTSVYAKKRSILGAVLTFTAPGIPMIFQGQEIMETQYFDVKFPVDWSNTDRFPGILALYRDLVNLRRDLRQATRGLRGQGLQIHHVNLVDKVIAFRRWDAGGPRDDTVVLLNFANRAFPSYTIGLPRTGTWRVRLNTDWSGYDAEFGNQPSWDVESRPEPRDGLPFAGDAGIGAYTAVILSQDE